MHIMRAMEPLRRIRSDVFGVSQSEFAAIAGVSQATISRWEKGELVPRLDELKRIREAALARGLIWNDAALFESSVEPAPELAAE
jgi:predicted transcriptional regulator